MKRIKSKSKIENEGLRDQVIPIYGNHDKTLEKWANTKTGQVETKSHNESPSNALFSSKRIVSSPSEAFRTNWDNIIWEKS